MRPIRFALVGPGNLGSSLAAAWVRSGQRCVSIHGGSARRRKRLRRRLRVSSASESASGGGPEFDLLLIAAPDRAIRKVAREWAVRTPWRGRVAFHSSGALPSGALAALRRRGAAVASFHPLISLPEPRLEKRAFQGVYIGIEGDPAAIRLARRLAAASGSIPLPLPGGIGSLYHLCACLSSGYLLALIAGAADRLRGQGVPIEKARSALIVLARSTLENAARLGVVSAITGPMTRGDVITLRRHLGALRRQPERWRLLHRHLALECLDLVRRSGRVRAEEAARIRSLLGQTTKDH